MRIIQVGYHGGEMKKVQVSDGATAGDVVKASGIILGRRTVNFNNHHSERSTSIVDSLTDRVPDGMDVWLMPQVVGSHSWQTCSYRAERRRLRRQ